MLLRKDKAMKSVAKFTSPNGKQVLIVAVSEGKKGFNLKASVKEGKTKAQTGCRNRYATEAEALASFKKLAEESTKNGWVKATITSKNAFTSIPKAAGSKAAA